MAAIKADQKANGALSCNKPAIGSKNRVFLSYDLAARCDGRGIASGINQKGVDCVT